MEKDAMTLLAARAEDWYTAAAKKGIAAGDFLGPAEQSYLISLAGRIYPEKILTFFGGYDQAERRVPVFCTDEYRNRRQKQYDCAKTDIDWDSIDWEKDDWWEVPLTKETISTKETAVTCDEAGIVSLRLRVPKGAQLPGHRDCLGTLMGLGLERSAVGDIVVLENAVWLFVKDTVAAFLVNSLTRVAKSPVQVEISALPKDFAVKREYEEMSLTLGSLRADAVTAAIVGCSREEAKSMVTAGLFRRNYLPLAEPAFQLAEGDVFSIQGKGRFLLFANKGETKKGRLRIILQKYI